MAVPGLDVGHAVPFVAEAPARLSQQLPVGDLDGELAPPRAHDLAAHPDPIAQVEADELVEAGRRGGQGEELHRARGVAQLGEGELSLGPRQHEPSGDRDDLTGLLTVGQAGPALDDLRCVVRLVEAVGDVALTRAHGFIAVRVRSSSPEASCMTPGTAHEPLLVTLRS